jgi:hypothetical protein
LLRKNETNYSWSIPHPTDNIDIKVEVINSLDGTPVRKASSVLTGEGTSAVNITDENGIAILRLKRTDFAMDAGEGYLDLEVMANGFQDYTNDYAVKLVR